MPAGPGPRGPVPDRIALLLWGDVIEDYLDRIGLTVEDFVRDVSSGWMFGYIAGLRAHGVDTVLVLVSAGAARARRTQHGKTGTTIWVLPPSLAFRATGRAIDALQGPGLLRRALRSAATEVRAYAATPVLQLARVARRERVRALLCQEYESPRFDACVLLGLLSRRPVFGVFQGGSRQHHRLERLLRPRTVRRAAGLVIGASVEAERVTRRYRVDPSTIARIGNPVSGPAGQARPELRRLGREELGVGCDTVVIAWHGRVEVERKGLDLLLAAWALVRERRPGADLHLALMGSGGDADRLRGLLASSGGPVTWIDEYVTDRDRIDRFLAAADVYAFPSPHEGFPVAPLEAMLAGAAVVATAAPGVGEIFDGGERSGGIVVPVGDVQGFTRALLRLVDDREVRADLARRARARAEDRYSVDAVGRDLRVLLRRAGALGAALEGPT